MSADSNVREIAKYWARSFSFASTKVLALKIPRIWKRLLVSIPQVSCISP